MARREREILERAVHAVSKQAAPASAILDEAIAAALDGSHPLTVHAKMLRLKLLSVKRDLGREFGRSSSTAPNASDGALGRRPSVFPSGTGRTGSRRRTANRPSEGTSGHEPWKVGRWACVR